MFPILRCLSHSEVLQKRRTKKKKIEDKSKGGGGHKKNSNFFLLGFRDLKLETKDFKKFLA